MRFRKYQLLQLALNFLCALICILLYAMLLGHSMRIGTNIVCQTSVDPEMDVRILCLNKVANSHRLLKVNAEEAEPYIKVDQILEIFPMPEMEFHGERTPSGQQSVNVDLQQLLHPTVIFKTDLSESSIIVEDGDTFQCGKCLNQFDFTEFIIHKKTNCSDAGRLMDDETDELLSQAHPPLEEEERTVPQDNNNQQLVVGLDGGVFSFKVGDDPNQNSILVEPFQEYEELGGPSISIIESDDTNPIIGNNYLLSQSDKDSTNEILLAQEIDLPPTIEIQSINGEVVEDPSTISEDGSDDDDGEEDEERRETEIAHEILLRAELTNMKCFYCQKEFRKNFDLQQHLRSHTGERPFQCIVCGRAFAQKSNVMKHMATHKVWPKKINTIPHVPLKMEGNDERLLVEKMFMCQYCPSIFDSYADLKSHRTQHIAQKVFKCVQKSCPLTFKELDEFLRHATSHTDLASFECHICHFEFATLDELGQHQLYHEKPPEIPPKRLTCKLCRSKFMSVESMEKHMMLDSHRHACPTCDKVFLSERFLRRHIGTHSPVMKFSCPVCQKAFRTEHYLNTHTIIHTQDKPFACEICKAKFNRRDKLARHHLSHENAKRYKCPFSQQCNKEFNRKDKLKQHMSTHTAWKKYSCKHCYKTFSTLPLCENHEFLCAVPRKTNGRPSGTQERKSTQRPSAERPKSSREVDEMDLPADTQEPSPLPMDLTAQGTEVTPQT